MGGALAALGATLALVAQGEVETFETMPVGAFGRVESAVGVLEAEGERLVILDTTSRGWDAGRVLRIQTGPDGATRVGWELVEPAAEGATLTFRGRRAMRPASLEVRAVFHAGETRLGATDLTSKVSRGAFSDVVVELPAGADHIDFEIGCDGAVALLMDDLGISAPARMELESAQCDLRVQPLVAGRTDLHLADLSLRTRGALEPLTVANVVVREHGEGVALETLVLDTGGARVPGRPTESGWVFDTERVLEPGETRWSLRGSARATGDGWQDLALSPGLGLDVTARVAGSDEDLVLARADEAKYRLARVVVSAAEGHGVVSTALAPVGVTPTAAGAVLGAIEVVQPSGTHVVRTLRWDSDGAFAEARLAPPGEGWHLARPTLVAERRTGAVVLAVEGVAPNGDLERPDALFVARSSDGGRTFSALEQLDVVDDDDAGAIGGCIRLAGGRGVIDGGGRWVLPIVRSFGHPKSAGAVLVSKDEGGTWTVSTGAIPGAVSVSVVALGEMALLIDGADAHTWARTEASTLNAGVWWVQESLASRPERPASPLGTAYVHVGLDTGWGTDGRLVLATAPEGRGPGVELRGTNDSGAIWHEERRALLDSRAGAGVPAIAPVDAKRLVVLYRSGDGDLLLEVRALSAFTAPLKSVRGLFGSR